MRNFIILFILISNSILFAQQNSDFYNIENIVEFKINFPQKDWVGLLDSLKINGDEFFVTSVSIDGQKYDNVGVQFKSNLAYKLGQNKNPLVVLLNYINSNQNHKGYSQFYLSVALRDPSMSREVISYDILRNYMPAPQANFAKVFINNQYVGLYVNTEEISDSFLEKHFGYADGSFFKASSLQKEVEGCRKEIYGALQYEENAKCYLGNFKMISRKGWDDLINLTKILNQNPDQIETVLDVDRTLWMLAFNNLVVNLSSYTGEKSHNYYLYKDKSGKFSPILSDLNLAFGSFKNTGIGSDLKFNELQTMDPLLHLNNDQKPLISKLLKNPMYQKQYLSHLRTMVYNHFENQSYLNKIESIQRKITNAFIEDPNKIYTLDDLQNSLNNTIGEKSKIPGIKELMEKRSKFLKKHSTLQAIPPTVKDISFNTREKYSTEKLNKFVIKAKVENYPRKVYLYYRFSPNDIYQTQFLTDDATNGDEVAGDKIFTATIDPSGKSDKMEYYIMTENTTAIGYEPYNYMYFPKTISLKEIN